MDILIADNNKQHKITGRLYYLLRLSLVLVFLIALVPDVFADARTQAKRMHERIAGVPPSASVLDSMAALIDGANTGNPVHNAPYPDGYIEAAYLAMNNKHFYNTTLVHFVTPWTNEARSVFPLDMDEEGTLNDYTATVIGAVKDEIDFRKILYDNIIYVGKDSLGLTNYQLNSNIHYKELEQRAGLDLEADLERRLQSNVNGLPTYAVSGVLTSRAGAKAFFVDGTNRAMFRFTVLNHLCKDMEQLKDITLPADRIRQDVSRSPGGDSRIFMNECIGCHTGMDPMTQAFAYFDYEYPADNDGDGMPEYDEGFLVYNDVGTNDIKKDGNPTTVPDANGDPVQTRVQEKNLINASNFETGFITTNEDWINYWRLGKNSLMNWDTSLPGRGSGPSSMAKELAHSEQFARCQVEKVFKTVCFRPPVDQNDRDEVERILGVFKVPFKNTEGYELKRVFAETAAYCRGQ